MDQEEIWKYCKIVEENETGEIILHTNNLQALIDTWSKIRKDNEPITICSFIGPESCGKSFFSNLFIEYVEMHGSLSWTKRIKREGLKGFSYGVEPNAVTDGQLIPEKGINALYFYPILLKLNIDQREEFICIVHTHYGNRKSGNKEVDNVDIALDTVLAMMSSILVNVMWNDKNVLSEITDLATNSSYLPVKDHLTKNVIHVLRGAGERENENVIHLEESASLHDNKGLVKLSFQQYSAVNSLMEAISTSQNFKQFQETSTLSNMLDVFKEKIKIINLCNMVEKSLTLSAPTPMENAPKPEIKTVDEYKPESKRIPKRRKENARMRKEIEDKVTKFFFSQFSQQAKPEINQWINNVIKIRILFQYMMNSTHFYNISTKQF